MIEITWEQISKEPFQKAVVGVNNARDIDAKTVYRAGRICQVARKEAEKIQKIRVTLAEKHGYSATENKFPSAEAEQSYEEELNNLLTTTKVAVKVHPLDWKQIFGKVKLTGLELVHLRDICENIDEEQL